MAMKEKCGDVNVCRNEYHRCDRCDRCDLFSQMISFHRSLLTDVISFLFTCDRCDLFCLPGKFALVAHVNVVLLTYLFTCFFQRVIQVNTLEDRSVHNKQQWDSALKFMETAVKDKLEQSKSEYSSIIVIIIII